MNQPELFNEFDVESLHDVLAKVEDRPISSAALAFKARRYEASPNVVEFFESIPGGTMFKDKKDIIRRARQTSIFEEEANLEASQ